MISEMTYKFLEDILSTGLIEFPPVSSEVFPSGHIPKFRDCYVTAAQAESELGLPKVAGVAFLDLAGKLYPWPHFVNMRPSGELVDISPRPDQPMLGFIRIGHHQIPPLQTVINEYDALAAQLHAPTWNDALADALTEQFRPQLVAAYNAQVKI